MAATLIARLVEKRKLTWETTIGQAFPGFRKSVRPEYRGVTLTQLLSHRSGISGEELSPDAKIRQSRFELVQ